MSDAILMSKPHFSFGNVSNFNVPSLSIPKQNPMTMKASESIDPQSHSRSLAKIASLERTIDRLNRCHSTVLKDLYKEVENLQNTITDLTLKKSAKTTSLSDVCHKKVEISESKTAQSTTPNDTQESIYLLLQEQKNKYRGIVDRLSHDNKKKSHTIDIFKNQLDLIKKALSLAGLELDMKELQALVSHRVKEKDEQELKVEKTNLNEKIEESSLIPQTQVELDIESVKVIESESNQTKKQLNLEETQTQISKSYIKNVLNLNRKSNLVNHENPHVQEGVIKLSKDSKTDPEIQKEDSTLQEPIKAIFNQKEPLPPIHHIDEKILKSAVNTFGRKDGPQTMTCDKTESIAHFEDFETVSLNRWKNDTDSVITTENHSILELLNKHKSDKLERKQKLREKRFRSKNLARDLDSR